VFKLIFIRRVGPLASGNCPGTTRQRGQKAVNVQALPAGRQGGYGALFAVMVQIFLSITRVVVQVVPEQVIYHGVGFKLRADARFVKRSEAKLGVRVQRPLQICLEGRS
jgi:hypothetical protein